MATTRDKQRDAALEEDEDAPKGTALGVRRRFDEFGNNDEVLCNWCGLQFLALVDDEGRLKLKEL